MDLRDYTTADLVAELSRRAGVDVTSVEPYQDIMVSVNGPAIVLSVFD